MIRTADISPCGMYRYRLSRIWHDGFPPLTFVMLNPSTADAEEDDPTIRRCVGFARRNDFGGIHVVNLFAYRSTNPNGLCVLGRDIIGPFNDKAIRDAAYLTSSQRGKVVVAWGANARHRPRRVADVLQMLREITGLYCLRRLVDGTPAHPLMLPYSCKIEPLRYPEVV